MVVSLPKGEYLYKIEVMIDNIFYRYLNHTFFYRNRCSTFLLELCLWFHCYLYSLVLFCLLTSNFISLNCMIYFTDKHLSSDVKYSFFIRAWFDQRSYAVYKSNGVSVVMLTPPSTGIRGASVSMQSYAFII